VANDKNFKVKNGIDINGVVTATGGTSTNWNAAFGWGDHSVEGYVTADTALMDAELTSIADVKALDQSVVSGATPVFGIADMTIDDTNLIVADTTNLQTFVDEVDNALLKARGTGVASTYVSSVSVGGTTFAQPAVVGEIHSDEGYFGISYAGATGITVTNLSSSSTYVYIDKNGALQQQSTIPTREDWSRKIFTMRIAVESSVILGFEYLNNPIGDYANSIRDVYAYLLAQGIPFKKDQTITGRATNLGFDISSGSLLEFGGTGDIFNPNIKNFSSVTNAEFFLSTRTGFDAGGNTALPKFWDNNGVLTALGSTTLVGHRLYRFSNGNVCLQYGQGNYANLVLAKAGVVLENYVLNPALANATFFGWWFIESTATNTGGTTLTDFVEYTIGVQGGSSGAFAGCLLKGNNLSDLLDASSARTNLGLGTGDSPTFASVSSTGVVSAAGGSSTNWNTAYGWGDHASTYLPLAGGTLTGNLDGTTADFSSSVEANNFNVVGGSFVARNPGNTNGSLWLASSASGTASANGVTLAGGTDAYSYHNSSGINIKQGGLLIDDTEVIDSSRNLTNIGTISSGSITATGYNDANWNTAYGWGNHASAGYVTTNTTYSAGTGVTLTGTTFSLTDTNAKLNLSGGTLTGGLTISESTTPTLILNDSGNAGGGGAAGRLLFSNTAGNVMGFGYTADDTASSDLIISTNAAGTYGGYLGLDAAGANDPSDIILEPKNNVRIATGNLQIGSTTVIDTSRNLTNIGTISSGIITATGGNSTNWNTAYGWGDHTGLYQPTNQPTFTGLTTVSSLTSTGITTISSAVFPVLRLASLTGSSVGVIDFGDTDDNDVGRIKYTHTTDKMDFITGAQQTLSLHGDGITVSGTVLAPAGNFVEQITTNGIVYPLTIAATDVGNTVDQGVGDGVGLQFKLANNAGGGGSFLGASIAATRVSATDDNSTTDLEFYISNNDETLDKVLTLNADLSAAFEGTVTATGYNDTNWNTAYGWGDHSTAGYASGSFLPLAGGTLTGNLDGTTADFSSSVEANNFNVVGGSFVARNPGNTNGSLWLASSASGTTSANGVTLAGGTNAYSYHNSSGINIKQGGLLIDDTEVIDSSRNLTNIGTLTQSNGGNNWSHGEAINRPVSKKLYSEVNVGSTGTAYTDVYGEADLTNITNDATFTYNAAWAALEAVGARLPTLAELEDGVGSGSGQGYDSEYLWTCTVAGPHHVWVCYGNYSTYGLKKIVDITDAAEVYRVRGFFDVDRNTRQVNYNSSGDLAFGDSQKATFGAGDDLQIFHDGSNSYIQDAATGSLILKSNNILLTSPSGESMMQIAQNDFVKLYHDNAEKLSTTATGIDVTGSVVADGLTVTTASTANLGTYNYSSVDRAKIEGQQVGAAGGKLDFQTNTGAGLISRMNIDHIGDVSFYEDTGTTAKMVWDASAESLGIGTTATTATLNIQAPTPAVRFYDSNLDTRQMEITAENGNCVIKVDPNQTEGTSIFAVQIDATERMRIDSSGSLGIGESSPDQKLHVSQAINNDFATIKIENSFGSGSAVGTGSSLQFSGWDAGVSANIKSIRAGSSYSPSALTFETFGGAGTTGSNTLAERMRINEFGLLGIGTSSPDTLVHLSATAGASLRFEATDTTINSGQHYGRLEFEGNDAGTSAGGIRARIDALSTGQNGESALVFNTSGVGSDSDNEAMRIDSTGIDVTGTVTATGGNSTNWNTAYTYSQVGHLPLAGGTLTGALEIQSNGDALNLRSTTNAQPVRITFSSDVPDAQIGHIEYTHSDTASYGSNEALIIGGTEPAMTILADGKLMFRDGIYSKPATGTGAGTRKDANWDTAYGWGDHSTAGYASGSFLPLAGGTLTGNLDGTTADFSSSVEANNFNVVGGSFVARNPGNTNGSLWLASSASGTASANGVTLAGGTNAYSYHNSSGINIKQGGLLIDDTEVIDSSRNLTNIGTISSGAISASTVGVTNIVTNKIVKFGGSILDDSNITDTGSLITLGSDTVVSGNIQATNLTLLGGSDNLRFTEASGDWSILNLQQNNGLVIYDGASGVQIVYNNVPVISALAGGAEVDGTLDVSGNITSSGTGTFNNKINFTDDDITSFSTSLTTLNNGGLTIDLDADNEVASTDFRVRLDRNSGNSQLVLDASGNLEVEGAITSSGNTVLTTEDYDTFICHLKTNVDSALVQGAGNAFTVNFNLEDHNDSSQFTHTGGVVTVLSTGWYSVYANLVYENSVASNRNTMNAYVKVNGTMVASTQTFDYDRGASYGRYSNNKVETTLYLTANDTVEIENYAENEDGAATVESAMCEFIVRSMTVASSSTNADTVDGLHGSQFVRSDVASLTSGPFDVGGTTKLQINQSGTVNELISSTGSFSATPLAFLTAGSERARIDSTGNLLVGKTSNNPNVQGVQAYSDGLLAVSKDSGRPLYVNRNTTDGSLIDLVKDGTTLGSIGVISSDLAIYSSTSGHNGLRLALGAVLPTNNTGVVADNSADLGSSLYKFKDLYLSGDVRAGNRVYIQGSTTNFLGQGPYSATNLAINMANSLFFYSGSTELASFSTTSASFKNQIIADKSAATTDTASATIISRGTVTTTTGYQPQNFHITFQNGGNVTKGSISSSHYATIYSTSSDYRLKEDLQPISNATERLLALNPVNFKWINGQQRSDGFIAHELQEHLPEAVTGTKDATAEVTEIVVAEDGTETEVTTIVPDMQGVDQSKLVPLLIKTIQELEARITALENA
jgi:hypothetical protein